jgi:sugar lactone lactonase YvrE
LDSNENLYIADGYNHRVQRWAPGATSGVTVAGGNGYGSAANQLDNPVAVALDSNGDLYVADEDNDRVQRWAPGPPG